jgi:hypothetical protein
MEQLRTRSGSGSCRFRSIFRSIYIKFYGYKPTLVAHYRVL